MKTLVLAFHPNLEMSRANKRLMEEVSKEAVTVRKMYDIYSDEQIDCETEQNTLLDYDRIVLQFPFYWYSIPPLLKKWLDEVFIHGWSHGATGDKLHGKELLLALTTGADKEFYTQEGPFHFSVEELLRPLEATSNLIGTKYLKPFVVFGGNKIPEEELNQKASEYAKYAIQSNLEIFSTIKK